MIKIRTLPLLIAMLVLVFEIPVYAESAPTLPAAFYGTITIGGSPAPVGTTVEARVMGVRTGIDDNPITITQAGFYGSSDPLAKRLLVQGDIVEGATISFFINGVPVDQTAFWHTGTLTCLQLNYATQITGDVNTSVLLQGGSRPDSGWVVPLTVKFFTPGSDVMVNSPVYTFNLTTAKASGTATAQCPGVTPGNYDITAISEHTLLSVRRNVAITAPSSSINFGTLLEGNANNNDRINIQDFGLLATSYGISKDNAAYNPMADFDRNNIANIFDFGLLATNYLKIAPIEVP